MGVGPHGRYNEETIYIDFGVNNDWPIKPILPIENRGINLEQKMNNLENNLLDSGRDGLNQLGGSIPFLALFILGGIIVLGVIIWGIWWSRR